MRNGPEALARSRFEWALDGQFLLQRTEVPVPAAPDSLTITGAWEKSFPDAGWEHDSDLIYRRAG
jgi:hypothetical protein